jgi:hypothetical protein
VGTGEETVRILLKCIDEEEEEVEEDDDDGDGDGDGGGNAFVDVGANAPSGVVRRNENVLIDGKERSEFF